MNRWATSSVDEDLAHRDAILEAQAMEDHNYEQVDVPQLTDQEDVMLLNDKGGVAPARYHRSGQDIDENGSRPQHVFEIWPGSAHSDMLPYEHAMRQTQAGDKVPRIAIFRAAHPEQVGHGLPLYAARDRLAT